MELIHWSVTSVIAATRRALRCACRFQVRGGAGWQGSAQGARCGAGRGDGLPACGACGAELAEPSSPRSSSDSLQGRSAFLRKLRWLVAIRLAANVMRCASLCAPTPESRSEPIRVAAKASTSTVRSLQSTVLILWLGFHKQMLAARSSEFRVRWVHSSQLRLEDRPISCALSASARQLAEALFRLLWLAGGGWLCRCGNASSPFCRVCSLVV